MKYEKQGNKLIVTLSDNDRYNTSIYEQLAAIGAKYPNYDTGHAKRTEKGWEVNPRIA